MSIWTDMQKRSSGEDIRIEDFRKIYNDENEEGTELYSDKYKDYEYTIYTNGKYPYIKISTKNDISTFSGYNLVKIYVDDKCYDLDRVVEGSIVGYIYFCNKQDDYVEGEHDGQKYSVSSLETIAKKIIDQICESERKYQDDSNRY